jgi:hypothetical protein
LKLNHRNQDCFALPGGIAFDGATGEPTLLGRIYHGYTISPTGSFIGLVWAFFDGLIGGAVFGWIYNKIVSFEEPK